MNVQIDEDIYELLQRQSDFRESESDVLRRLLSPLLNAKECVSCGKPVYVKKIYQIGESIAYTLGCGHLLSEKAAEKLVRKNGSPTIEMNGSAELALLDFVSDPALLCRNTTDRYLAILGFAFKDKRDKFARVLEVSGRRRKYFADSREAIEESGTSTHPHPVPGSQKKYWAMTNTATPMKREMLSKALKVLEYSLAEVEAACRAIV